MTEKKRGGLRSPAGGRPRKEPTAVLSFRVPEKYKDIIKQQINNLLKNTIMSEQINLEEILKQELIPVVFAHSPEMTFLATLRAMQEACKQVLVLASKRVDKTIEDSEEEVYIVLSQEINHSILDTIREIV